VVRRSKLPFRQLKDSTDTMMEKAPVHKAENSFEAWLRWGKAAASPRAKARALVGGVIVGEFCKLNVSPDAPVGQFKDSAS